MRMGMPGCGRSAVGFVYSSGQTGIAGKAGIKGAKAAGIAADVSKWVSKTKNVLYYDKIKSFFQAIYHQVIKGPITETIRSFKHQWENFLENVGSVLRGPQLALAGIGLTRGVWMSGAEKEVKETTMNIIGKTGDGVVGKGIDNFVKVDKNKIIQTATAHKKGGETVVGHALQKHAGRNPHIWEKVKGGPAQINQMALKHLQEILNGTGGFKRVKNSRGDRVP